MCVQGTLVGILSCCCEEGDIDGATKILDQMRSLDMEISEEIYAALITGLTLLLLPFITDFIVNPQATVVVATWRVPKECCR